MGLGQKFYVELFERAPLGGTKAFYRMSKLILFKSYCILKFAIQRGSRKEKLDISTFNFYLNEMKVAPDDLTIQENKVKEAFLNILKFGNFMPPLHYPKMPKLRPCSCKSAFISFFTFSTFAKKYLRDHADFCANKLNHNMFQS